MAGDFLHEWKGLKHDLEIHQQKLDGEQTIDSTECQKISRSMVP